MPGDPDPVDGPLTAVALRFFERHDWHVERSDEPARLLGGYEGEHGRWVCYAELREAEQQALFYSLCPYAAPPERRTAVAELLNRLNWGLVVGNFELDGEDGQIRFRTSVDVEGDQLGDALFANLVYANLAAMDEALPELAAALGERAGTA